MQIAGIAPPSYPTGIQVGAGTAGAPAPSVAPTASAAVCSVCSGNHQDHGAALASALGSGGSARGSLVDVRF